MTSLNAMLRELIAQHPGADARSLAGRFLRTHKRGELVDLLADEVIHLQRARVRAAEIALLTARPSSASASASRWTVAAVREAVDSLEPLLMQRYRVGDGRERAGGEMTLPDWHARRAMLIGQANGLARSVAVCDRAIGLLEQTGAETLNEVRKAEAKAA